MINIPVLLEIFDTVVKKGGLRQVLDEIIKWSKAEFNYMNDDANTAGMLTDEEEDNGNA